MIAPAVLSVYTGQICQIHQVCEQASFGSLIARGQFRRNQTPVTDITRMRAKEEASGSVLVQAIE